MRTGPTSILIHVASVVVVLGAVGFIAPSVLGYERYVIVGNSMSGAFDRGAIAFEKPVPVTDLLVGDVITYLPPAESGLTNLVTHRVFRIRTTQDGGSVIRTKGDANADADPWKFQLDAPSQARVELTVPYVGHLLIALADRATRVYLMGLPAGLIALYSLGELIRALRRGRAVSRPEISVPSRTATSTPQESRPTCPAARCSYSSWPSRSRRSALPCPGLPRPPSRRGPPTPPRSPPRPTGHPPRQSYVKCSKTVTFASQMTAVVSTVNGVPRTVVTVTLGAGSSTSDLSTTSGTANMVWTPSTGALSLVGQACWQPR